VTTPDFSNAGIAVLQVRDLLLRKEFQRAAETAQLALSKFPGHSGLLDLAFLLAPQWRGDTVCQRYRLRATTEADFPFFQACFSDDGFMNQFHPVTPRQRNADALKRSLTKMPFPVAQIRAVHRVIEATNSVVPEFHHPYCKETPALCGLISLVEIDVSNRRAELLVGVPAVQDRGHGIALTACLLMFDFAFNQIGLNKLTTAIIGHNEHSHRSTLALGFAEEGFRKQHVRVPQTGRWVDSRDYGLVNEDFRMNTRLARLSQRLLGRDITKPVDC
jgi:RimJ/RimL family protein N-acetyltransferase